MNQEQIHRDLDSPLKFNTAVDGAYSIEIELIKITMSSIRA